MSREDTDRCEAKTRDHTELVTLTKSDVREAKPGTCVMTEDNRRVSQVSMAVHHDVLVIQALHPGISYRIHTFIWRFGLMIWRRKLTFL